MRKFEKKCYHFQFQISVTLLHCTAQSQNYLSVFTFLYLRDPPRDDNALISMAATCFNFTQASSGFKELHEYLQLQSYLPRFHQRSTCSIGKVLYRRCGGRLQVERWHQYQHVSFARRVEFSPSVPGDAGDETEEDISKETLIWRAIKLPIYSVAFVPLTVGSAAAYFQTGIFSARCYFVLLASSVLVITWLNLSNDVYDFDTGVDKNKKESVVNLVGSRAGTFIAAYLCLALGFAGLTWTAVAERNMRSILFLVCAIICGYIYQCPPFRLSYQGLGEPLCFAAFGPFATSAFYLLHGSSSVKNHFPLSGIVLSASILVGFTTSLILFCSHFHQVEGDKDIGKMSPLVRLGTKQGAEVVKGAVLMLYTLLVAFGLCKALPLPCIFLCALTLPMGTLVVKFVQDNHKDKNKIFMAKYFCVRLHALFGLALALGLVLARNTKFTPWPILSGRLFSR